MICRNYPRYMYIWAVVKFGSVSFDPNKKNTQNHCLTFGMGMIIYGNQKLIPISIVSI